MKNGIYLMDMVRQFTGEDNRVGFERLYCRVMGNDLCGGAFLSEIIFWSDKRSSAPTGWFYRSGKDWQERVYLSDYQVRKYTKICEEAGWLQTKVMKAEGSPTTHYSVDDDKFLEWILEFLRNESEKFENLSSSKIQESILTDTIPDTIPEANSKGHTPSRNKKNQTNQPTPQPAIPWQRQPSKKETNFLHLNARCPAAQRRPIVDALISVHGLQAVIDSDSPDADRELNKMHELACVLHEMMMGVKDIERFAKLWQEKDFRGKQKQRPQNGQFLTFISQQLADTSGFPAEDPGERATVTITDSWEA